MGSLSTTRILLVALGVVVLASLLPFWVNVYILGLLTVALTGGAVQSRGSPIATSKAVDHLLVAASADPRVVKEMHVTAYHVLWELVHVFFEQPGVLGPGVIT